MQTMREDSLKQKSEVNRKMNFAAFRFERCSRRRARIRMLRARRTSTPAVNHESLCEPRIALAPQSIARARDSRWPETALARPPSYCAAGGDPGALCHQGLASQVTIACPGRTTAPIPAHTAEAMLQPIRGLSLVVPAHRA